MPDHSESRIVPYTADMMYGIVADVERYPEFLPWCTGLRVLDRKREGALDIVTAEMLVGYRSIRERYTSRVELDAKALTIDVAQTDGPFRRLDNHWRFTPLGSNCRVDFAIAFDFKSRILGIVANAALGPVMLRMSEAFERRARDLSEQPLQ